MPPSEDELRRIQDELRRVRNDHLEVLKSLVSLTTKMEAHLDTDEDVKAATKRILVGQDGAGGLLRRIQELESRIKTIGDRVDVLEDSRSTTRRDNRVWLYTVTASIFSSLVVALLLLVMTGIIPVL